MWYFASRKYFLVDFCIPVASAIWRSFSFGNEINPRFFMRLDRWFKPDLYVVRVTKCLLCMP
jgi:hypothetical protein